MNLLPNWRPITRRTLDLFGRWGDPRSQLKSMLDGVLPVAVVDRFRGDDEGSIFGIDAFCTGNNNQFPSISFGSSVNDWELLAINQYAIDWAGLGGSKIFQAHLFTPIFPYNPALTLAPVGFFSPGLLLNRAFTFGTVSGLGGTNPALPALFGPSMLGPGSTGNVGLIRWFTNGSRYVFDPPIRVYKDITLTLQWTGTIGNTPLSMFMSILYRERPKVSQ